MKIDLEIQNYRCFAGEPVRFCIEPEFVAFVGPNNSGKSTLLRFFWEFRSFFAFFSRPDDWRVGGEFVGLNLPDGIDATYLSPRGMTRCTEFTVGIGGEGEEVSRMRASIDDERRVRIEFVNGRGEKLSPSQKGWESKQNCEFLSTSKGNVPLGKLTHALRILATTFYVASFRNSLDVKSEREYFDLAVGGHFIASWGHWKNGNDIKRGSVARLIEARIGELFELDGFEINPSSDGKTLRLSSAGQSYGLDEFGSGLAHCIIILAQVAMRAPQLILIDEPELGLHPTLQTQFLNELGKHARFATLYSTHSLGLARSADGMYSVARRKGMPTVRLFEATAHLAQFAAEMNYAGYCDLGFKRILLVEGKTDRRVFQQLLRKRRKDHEVVIISLGGSSMIEGNKAEIREQLEDLVRITGDGRQILAIIDNDKRQSNGEPAPERVRFKETCAELLIGCHILQLGAPENYWTKCAIEKVIPGKEPLEANERLNGRWSKEKNWRIAAEMRDEELAEHDLVNELYRFVEAD